MPWGTVATIAVSLTTGRLGHTTLQALEELHGQPSLNRRPVEIEEDTDEDYYQEAHIEIRIYLIHTM